MICPLVFAVTNPRPRHAGTLGLAQVCIHLWTTRISRAGNADAALRRVGYRNATRPYGSAVTSRHGTELSVTRVVTVTRFLEVFLVVAGLLCLLVVSVWGF